MKVKLLFLLLMITMLSACSVDRAGLCDETQGSCGPGEGIRFSVTPNFACPGDTATVNWDLNLPRDPRFCEFRNGGYADPVSCRVSSECPDSGSCIDGYCCKGMPESECGSPARGCPPDYEVTVSASPVPLQPPVDRVVNREETGSRSFQPQETTTVSLQGGFAPPATNFEVNAQRVVVVREPDSNRHTVRFAYRCGQGWSVLDISGGTPSFSPHVAITGVRNLSRHRINLFDPAVGRGPLVLQPGEVTHEFDGAPKGKWQVEINELDLASLPRPECAPTNQTNLYPDIELEVSLVCEVH